MNKRYIHFLIIIILFTIGLIIFQKKKPQEKVHYHAGFKVFVDNKRQDFSALKYMTIKPCSEEEEEHEENVQLEKAHLHDRVGEVMHVEAKGAKWSDLFKNIKYDFNAEKPLAGYINGKKVDQILDQPIKAFDSVIIISGEVKNLENKLKNSVTKKRIEQVEKKSESC